MVMEMRTKMIGSGSHCEVCLLPVGRNEMLVFEAVAGGPALDAGFEQGSRMHNDYITLRAAAGL